MMMFPNTNPYTGKLEKVKNLRNCPTPALALAISLSVNLETI